MAPADSATQRDDLPPPTPTRTLGDLGIAITITRPRCFRTDTRLTCRDSGCGWRCECRRLVAEWRR